MPAPAIPVARIIPTRLTGWSIANACNVTLSAAVGAVIGMAVEFARHGPGAMEKTTMNAFQSFLKFYVGIEVSNPATVLIIIALSVILCFIMNLRTTIAALYGGASVIGILTTGFPERPSATPPPPVRGGALPIQLAMAETAPSWSQMILVAAGEGRVVPLMICPSPASPYAGTMDVVWRTYHDRNLLERVERQAAVAGEKEEVLDLPVSPRAARTVEYELTVSAAGMKTIYYNSKFDAADRAYAIRIFAESGENSWLDWVFMRNLRAGSDKNLLTCAR